jgi:hypothetical protein
MPDAPPLAPSADAAFRDGEALFRRCRIAEAEERFAAARAAGLDSEPLAGRRWMCAMLRGDFATAWAISDDVLQRRGGRKATHLPSHLRWVWDGTPLAGRDVLVRCYHGLGDTLQFVRFAPALRRLARRVAVAAQPELLPLLASMAGIDALLPLDAPPKTGAVEIESMEVPHVLRVDLASLPADVPYLAVPLAHRRAARRLVAGHERLFKVGVVWAVGDWAPQRSLPFDVLAPLGEIPSVALVVLQRGPALRQLATAAKLPCFIQCDGTRGDILETAALLTHLDLIVTVDTMVAHLAGALARPVWTLLHFGADWRWLLEREDSPWYPTMRLFRQPAPGAWEPVLTRVAQELRRFSRKSARREQDATTARAEDDVATP